MCPGCAVGGRCRLVEIRQNGWLRYSLLTLAVFLIREPLFLLEGSTAEVGPLRRLLYPVTVEALLSSRHVHEQRASLVRRNHLMPGAKVLVVDDSWTDLTLIATPLRESGFEVITAVDGDEAIEKVLNEHPQCVVLDVILPRQNGFQLCRKIKHMEQSRNIPVILLSSKNTALDKRWGLQQGADLYLTKPFNRDELVASVRRLV